MAKKINLKDKNDKDLLKELNERRENLRSFRFGIAGSKIRNVKEGRDTKKQIAQILTEINFRHRKQAE